MDIASNGSKYLVIKFIPMLFTVTEPGVTAFFVAMDVLIQSS